LLTGLAPLIFYAAQPERPTLGASSPHFRCNRTPLEHLQPGRFAEPFPADRGDRLQPRDIIVIGGSTGSIESLKTIVRGLPASFPAAIFVVVHMTADYPSVLAQLLAQFGSLPASSPPDQQTIEHGHIYVARPDHHLIILDGVVRSERGPRENRHRPAIDPLFRSAAREYGPRVIGVVLSGLQDDGSAGLYAVKRRGGVAIVQDPRDTPWSQMPQQAVAYASPHYILRTQDIAANLVELVLAGQIAMPKKKSKGANGKNHKNKLSGTAGLERPEENMDTAYNDEGEGTPSVFACPECHGVLWEIKDGFRCRVGHSYGAEGLAKELSMASEAALWAAVRALEEKSAMQRRVAEGMRANTPMSARLLDQSSADAANAKLIRDMIFRRDAELETEEPHSESQERKTA
jgi:two-component system chemotaxis response regulator CheB